MAEVVLTRSEFEVLLGLCDNLSAKQIAERTYRVESTVKAHMHNLYGKLGAHNAPGAVRRAWRVGLLNICPTCTRSRNPTTRRYVFSVEPEPRKTVPTPPERDEFPVHRRKLSPRQTQVLSLIALGYSNEGIAKELGMEFHTARTHVGRVLMRLGVNDRAHAVSIGFAEGYLKPEDVQGSNKRK